MKAIIKKVNKGPKVGTVEVALLKNVDGNLTEHPAPLKFWSSSTFVDRLVVGAEVDIKTEERDNYDKTGKERWLIEVDGHGEKAAKGGGGGFKAAPKTGQEIHSASICGIIKSGIENQLDGKALEPYFEAYWKQMGRAS